MLTGELHEIGTRLAAEVAYIAGVEMGPAGVEICLEMSLGVEMGLAGVVLAGIGPDGVVMGLGLIAETVVRTAAGDS